MGLKVMTVSAVAGNEMIRQPLFSEAGSLLKTVHDESQDDSSLVLKP